MGDMTDDDNQDRDVALAALLDEADAVYNEYDQGYMDADAALSRLRPRIDALRDATEDE